MVVSTPGHTLVIETALLIHVYKNFLPEYKYCTESAAFYLNKFEQVFKVLFIIHRHPGPVVSPNTIVLHFSVIPKNNLKGEIDTENFSFQNQSLPQFF